MRVYSKNSIYFTKALFPILYASVTLVSIQYYKTDS